MDLKNYINTFNTEEKDIIIEEFFSLEENGCIEYGSILRKVTKDFNMEDNVVNMSFIGISFLKDRYKDLIYNVTGGL